MRNIEKWIEEGSDLIEKHKESDLKLSEILEFYQTAREKGTWDVIGDTFLFGVCVGSKISKRDLKKGAH